MKRFYVFCAAFAAAFLGVVKAGAESGFSSNSQIAAYPADKGSAGNTEWIDILAADFFENSLRLSQAKRIEAATSLAYLSLTDAEKQEFREERRRQWLNMTDPERRALKNVKTPAYDNLTENQKQVFRRHAMEALGWVPPQPIVSASAADI